MYKAFMEDSWEEYMYWQENDEKILKKINTLIKDIERNGPQVGLGKPKKLKGNLAGMYSRRITNEHRLVYFIKDDTIFIAGCRTHYGDK